MKTLRSAGVLLVALACVAPALAEGLPRGTVVVARTSPNQLLIWDSTEELTDLVGAKKSQAEELKALESKGVSILAARAAHVRTTKISLRIVYQRIGSVSPVYGSATFAGIERLLVLDATTADVPKHADQWKKQIETGDAPRGLTVTMTGALPPG